MFLHLINYLEGIIWFQDYDHDVPLTASSLICFDTKLHLIQSWPWLHSITGRSHLISAIKGVGGGGSQPFKIISDNWGGGLDKF